MDDPTNVDNANAENAAVSRRSQVGQWSGLLALVISALALAVGAYQTRLMQTQARASVWPYLTFGIGYNDSGENIGFTLHVQNNGVGPARVRSVQVWLDDKPVDHWDELIGRLLDASNKHGTANAQLSPLKDVVIPPSLNRDTDVSAIQTSDHDVAKAIYGARNRIKMEICYCSIYDDCWIARWQTARPDEVSACHESDHEFDF